MKKVDKNMINVNLTDAGNTYNYALQKIYEWGYIVSVVTETESLDDHTYYYAKKNGKTYLETSPVRLLGLLTIIEKYGQNWKQRKTVPHRYSLQQNEMEDTEYEEDKED